MQSAMGIGGDNNPVDVSVLKSGELSDADYRVWVDLRARNSALYSPYFHPGYTRLIGQLRDDAYVAVVKDRDHIVAFFPFQGPRGQGGFARPIGAPMTDYHGFIQSPETELDCVNILKLAGIGALHYNALIDQSGSMSKFNTVSDQGTMLDISDGCETWRGNRDGSYRRHLKSHRRRIRKSEEEFGPRRFEFKSKDPAVFDQLIAWKRKKFEETGKYDVLSSTWTMDLLKRLWASEGELRCDMQVLYFGDRIAAIDLGLTDGVTFHSWIVAYDGDLQSFGPGIQLLEGLIDAAQDQGYGRIDLGAGTDGYKRHYATENVEVGSGFVAVTGPAAALSQIYGATERWGQKALCDAPGKLRRRYSQIAACDDTLSGRAKAMLDAVKASTRK